jgi:glucose/arabinose dehydrogenase
MRSPHRCAVLLALSFACLAPSVRAEAPKVECVRAFPELEFVRPIVLTHANDGTNRVFVASQLGKVHVFANDQAATEADTKVFLDIESKVEYKDRENEEGLLGMAFHPKFKENGEFFIYYTTTDTPHTSVISRFRVSKDDPNVADPASEEEIIRIPQPYWNHNGGTIVFGPDGYLYVGLGDGGAGGDPHKNAQNLETLLGKVLRIDVDHKDEGLNYAIPKDNPFVGKAGARGEIWAYGIRNIWRMAFDSETGVLWAGDVGQDLWEEIDLIVRGGNYGWSLREGQHAFKDGEESPEGFVEPIFEYHHDLGKSITGGNVYRGKRIPSLVGKYLYADYVVSDKVFALDYDMEAKKVVSNETIPGNISPIVSFGEDEQGETYYMTVLPDNRGQLFWFQEAGKE